MEIERKYLIDATKLPFSPEDYPVHHIEQGYLCTDLLYASAKIMKIIFLPTNQKD